MEFEEEELDTIVHALDMLHDIQAGNGLEEADDTFDLMMRVNKWKQEYFNES